MAESVIRVVVSERRVVAIGRSTLGWSEVEGSGWEGGWELLGVEWSDMGWLRVVGRRWGVRGM